MTATSNPHGDDPIRIAYDVKQMRPGCVIVAAAMGADIAVVHSFDPEDWLTAPTPDMFVYPLPRDKLPELVARTRAHRTRKQAA